MTKVKAGCVAEIRIRVNEEKERNVIMVIGRVFTLLRGLLTEIQIKMVVFTSLYTFTGNK